jgi:N-acetylglucosamine kinase-like BadF-type ATPase
MIDLFIGVDVGGTNTDAVLMDGVNLLAKAKLPTTSDVTSGVVASLEEVLAQRQPNPSINGVMVGRLVVIVESASRRFHNRRLGVRPRPIPPEWSIGSAQEIPRR